MKKTSSLTLESFLIMPVQRVPRYLLLLQDMLKYTREGHPDYIPLQKSINTIREQLTKINSNISNEELEHTKKLISIEQSVEGEYEVLFLLFYYFFINFLLFFFFVL